MMRTLNNPCFCFPQPPPAQSMVQALELLYALGGEYIILCFAYSFLKGVVQLKLFVVFFFNVLQPPQNFLSFVQSLLHTGKQRKSKGNDFLGGTRKLHSV